MSDEAFAVIYDDHWSIRVNAANERQAKYRAWLKFKDAFGTTFKDFVCAARVERG